MIFKMLNKDFGSNVVTIESSESKTTNIDIATLAFNNYDADTSNSYQMGALSVRDHYGTSNLNGYGDLVMRTGVSNVLAEQMRILYNGNVGIGTSNPTSSLDVAGEIHSTNITRKTISTNSSSNLVITLNWTYSSNQNYIIAETVQDITTGLHTGIRTQRQTIDISNPVNIIQQMSSGVGDIAAYSSLLVTGVNATSNSVGLCSLTSWTASNILSHNLNVNILIMPSQIGSIFLS